MCNTRNTPNAYIETNKRASRCSGQVVKKARFYTKHIQNTNDFHTMYMMIAEKLTRNGRINTL